MTIAAQHHDEEPVNFATHAAGAAFAVVAAIAVVTRAFERGTVWHVWGSCIYAFTLVAAYAASSLSHAFRAPTLVRTFRIADQAIIFLFIAGSYTPIALAWLRASPWWVLHVAIWGVALAGFASKAIFASRVHLGSVSTSLYILLGCLPLTCGRAMYAAVPHGLSAWIVAGGIFYLAGTIFFHFDHRIRYFHAAWHLMVLSGSVCHFVGIITYCTG